MLAALDRLAEALTPAPIPVRPITEKYAAAFTRVAEACAVTRQQPPAGPATARGRVAVLA